MIHTYKEYIEAYQFYVGCNIPELNAIVGFTDYWESEGIPPHMWRDWLREHKATFVETGSVHDVLKALKRYAEFSRKKYLEEVEFCEQNSLWGSITQQLQKLW